MLVRLYETLFITQPEAEAETVEKIRARLQKSMEGLGGVELKLVDWGKRKLAYEIAKHKKGNYWYYGYVATPDFVKELERQLRLSPDVIRYQTIRLSELVKLETVNLEDERKRVDSLTPEREEDEEEQYLRRGDEFGRRRRDDFGDDGMEDDIG